MTKAYKVLNRAADGNLYGAITYNRKCRVKYSDSEFVTPKIGKIFVFNTLENAAAFKGGATSYQIWEVEVDTLIPSKHSAEILFLETNLDLFWSKWFNWLCPKIKSPVGSFLANRVRLVREIK